MACGHAGTHTGKVSGKGVHASVCVCEAFLAVYMHIFVTQCFLGTVVPHAIRLEFKDTARAGQLIRFQSLQFGFPPSLKQDNQGENDCCTSCTHVGKRCVRTLQRLCRIQWNPDPTRPGIPLDVWNSCAVCLLCALPSVNTHCLRFGSRARCELCQAAGVRIHT